MNPGTSDLVITIGGDLSELQAAFDQVQQLAQQSFSQIESAVQNVDFAGLSAGADGVRTSLADVSDAASNTASDLGNISEALNATASASSEALGNVDTLTGSLSAVDEATASAASTTGELNQTMHDEAEAASEAVRPMAELAEGAVALGEALAVTETLKEFATEALNAAGAEQAASVALQALGSSAAQASETVEGLVQMSMQIPVATATLLQAQERMQAVGIPLAQISTLMTDVAASSALMGTNIMRATVMLDSMVVTGSVAAQSLARLGINVQQLVDAINHVAGQGTASIQNFAAAFKQLDQSQAIQVVELAMQGLANNVQAQAATINGQLQLLSNTWEAVMVQIGNTIAPTTGPLVTGLTSAAQAVLGLATAFKELPAPIQALGGFLAQVGTAAAIVTAGMVLLVGALGAATLATIAFNSAAVMTPLLALSGAITPLLVELGEFAAGATVASGALTTLSAAASGLFAIFAPLAGAFVGWQLGHMLSDWINSIDGFTAAQQKAQQATQGFTQVASANAAQAMAGAQADEDFAQSLNTLGVSFDQLSVKGTVARAAIQSYANAGQEVATQIANTTTNLANETQLLNDYQKVVSSASSSTSEIGAATTLYDAALKKVAADQQAANGGLLDAGTAILVAANAFAQLQVAVANTQTAFVAVAQGYASGAASLSQYTAALNAMNKAQMDANNGLEQGATAALLAANDYTNISAKATNAQTTVTALGAAAASGAVSWTQYDAALKQLVADEENANNGLVSLRTEIAVEQEAFQNLAVAQANAQTTLQAIVAIMGSAAGGTKVYTDALNALQAAQTLAAQGATNLNTAILQAANTQAQANLQWKNTETALQAAYQYYVQTGQGVEQLIQLTEKLSAAQSAASNGILSWASAQQQLIAQNSQLTIGLQNANTILAQAKQLYDDGAIGLGQLEKAEQAVTQAQAALDGTTKSATASTQALTGAHNGLTSALNGTHSAMSGVTSDMEAGISAGSTFATNLQYINGEWVAFDGYAAQAVTNVGQYASNVQTLNGTLVQLGQASATATTGTSQFATTLAYINGQLTQIPGSAAAAAAGIAGIGAAAQSAAADLSSLGTELDKTMNAQLGTVSLSPKPGDIIKQPTGLIGGTEGLGIQDPSGLLGISATGLEMMNTGMSTIYDSTSTLTTAIKNNSSATVASTAATANATAATAALASTAATAAAVIDTSAMGSANALNGLNDGTVALAISLQGVSSAAASISATVQGAAAVIGSVASSIATTLGPGQGVYGGTSSTPLLGTTTPVVGSTTSAAGGVGGTPNFLGINVNAGTVVGNGGMQQLTNMIGQQLIQLLQSRGIRITRQ